MPEVSGMCPRCGRSTGHSCANCGWPRKEDWRGTPRSITYNDGKSEDEEKSAEAKLMGTGRSDSANES